GKTKKIQLQKMLDYISTKECRRAFLIAYFGETSAGEKHNCCDNDGALLKAKPVKQLNSEAHLSWEKIIQKIFKNDEKD
ncbi:RecQ family zinc-binding domain-containing protein, partial [Streptococcus anginosus]